MGEDAGLRKHGDRGRGLAPEETGGGAGQLNITVHVRPRKRLAGRCGICGRKRPGYDQGEGRRRWRALDLGPVTAELEADAPRVACPQHGVVTAAVPWARHGARHTRFFDDQVAWLAASPPPGKSR